MPELFAVGFGGRCAAAILFRAAWLIQRIDLDPCAGADAETSQAP